jgi:hypothetical protein
MSTPPMKYFALMGDTVPGGASRLILMASFAVTLRGRGLLCAFIGETATARDFPIRFPTGPRPLHSRAHMYPTSPPGLAGRRPM